MTVEHGQFSRVVQSERYAAVRLLKALMVASVVLPMALFAITAWVDYRNFERITNERIARSLDVLHEHSLKVLETVELAYAEVNEVVRGMSDNDIRLNEAALNKRLKRIVTDAPQMQGIEIVDRNGHPLVSSNGLLTPGDIDFSKAEYFTALKSRGGGTYVSTINAPGPGVPGYFISLSQRRPWDDGAFNGVISIAVLTSYFENFYAHISGTVDYFALVRADGHFLARYPVVSPASLLNFDDDKDFSARIARGDGYSVYTVESPYDHITRRIRYRKIAGYPLYVLAGVE